LFCTSLKAKELKGPLQTGWKGEKVCELLSENTQQRILRCTFPPGVGHERHKHNANFGYAIAGGKMQITDEKETKTVNLVTDSYFESKGKKWHEVLNVGQSTIVYLIVESKSKDGKA
jgi:quercetin dioxygenase-like cupin family protein